jgi:hypothetical protein
MSKSAKSASAKKSGIAQSATPVAAPKPAATTAPAANSVQSTAGNDSGRKRQPGSKQSRVIAMLLSPAGATIAAMMKATGWQQHSVRGFLAGVVRKRLKLKLGSKKVDGNRIYQIAGGDTRPRSSRAKPQSR